MAAVALLPGALAAREGSAYWLERSARREMAAERFDDARRHIDLALRVRDRPAWHLLAARIARQRGDYSEAERHLTRCEGPDGLSEPVRLEWRLLRVARGDVDELAPALLASVESGNPESPAILDALAGAYMRQTRYHDSLRCLDRWVALEPGSARALDWRGWVSNQLDHRAQAIADYEQAMELQPDRSAVRLRLAEILVESSRHAEAVPHLERLRDEQPDNPDVLVALANCRIVQSRPDEAKALLDRVLAARPDHFGALLQRGKVEAATGNFAEAERWLRKALERSPLDADARYALYLALQAQPGREADAREELDRWQRDRKTRDRLTRLLRVELDQKPNDANLACEAGELLMQQGEERKGLFWLRRALALDPRHAAAGRALAAYYERHNESAPSGPEK